MLSIKNEMKAIKDKFERLHIEVVDTLFEEDAPGHYNRSGLFYMAKSIDIMGQVDAVYFVKDWNTARGCQIEREIAKAYGVKILDYDFIEEPKEELVRIIHPNMPNEFNQRTPISEQPYKITCLEDGSVEKHIPNLI